MPNQANIQAVDLLSQTIDAKANFLVLSYRGITVNELNSLRDDLRQQGIVLKVVKNNLFRLALKEKGIEGPFDEFLVGPNMVAFSETDLSGPAKILKKYIKSKGKASPLEIKMGVSDGTVYEKNDVEAIADLPSKEELLAKIMGSINSPASGIAGVMHGVMSKLARAIKEVAQKNDKS